MLIYATTPSPRDFPSLLLPCKPEFWMDVGSQTMANPNYEPYHRQFIFLFRMSKIAFASLVNLLEATPVLGARRVRAIGRPFFSLELVVMICLFRLGQVTTVQGAALMFGVSAGSVSSFFADFIDAVFTFLRPRLIVWPDEAGRRSIAASFSRMPRNQGRIQGVVGAIDGSHIRLDKRLLDPLIAAGYFNRKQYWSMLLQGIVDSTGLFRNVVTGVPGSADDSRMYRRSDVAARPDLYFSLWQILVGDSAYPLSRYLLKGFDEALGLTDAQIAFNKCVSSMRISVEMAFGRLKARWRILSFLAVEDLELCARVIVSCCVLHNHVQIHDGPLHVTLEADPQPPRDGGVDPEAEAWRTQLVQQFN